jgi:tetratricopeptide (TPR) repeat protein
VLRSNPSFPCVHSQLGFIYVAQQEDSAASREFADESEGCALADLGEARLHIDAGENADAMAVLRALWKNDEGFVRSHAALLTNGLASDRLTAFSSFIDRQSTVGAVGAELYESLSAALRGVPQPVSGSTLSASAKGSGIPADSQRAEVDVRDGRYGRCAADLADDLPKESSQHLLILARCAFMTGDYALSAAASDLLSTRLPHNMAAIYWSVKANEKLAFVAFGTFEQLEPNSERTHLLLGDMYRQRQRFQQAESEYKMASTLAPKDTAPLFGLASAYYHDSNTDKALSVVKTALRMAPNDPELNLLAGEILVSTHEWAQAEDYLKRGLNAKPQMLPHLHALLGEVYEHTGRTREAISELQMGVASDEDGTVYYQLARLYSSIGNDSAAEDAFRHMKVLQKKRRESAAIAVQDSSDAMENDIH